MDDCDCSCYCDHICKDDTPEDWDAIAQYHRDNDESVAAWYASRVADHLRFYTEHVAAVAKLKAAHPTHPS